jgi:antitoxin (DNA-binding transcriptional repressor) of toxin-antitoxin stability system
MEHMRTASISEVRRDFSRILEWVANGETVAITRHRETVAHLFPATRKKITHAKMPDVTLRLQKVFGRKVISDKAMTEVLDKDRENY